MLEMLEDVSNWSEQSSEIVALRSILGDDFRVIGGLIKQEFNFKGDYTELLEMQNPDSSLFCQATVYVDVPEEGIEVAMVQCSSSTQPQTFNPVKIQHLPALCLDLELKIDYPSHSRPEFRLSCFWLSLQQLNRAGKELEKLWNEQQGTQICFSWIDWIHTGLLDFLGLSSTTGGRILLDQFSKTVQKVEEQVPVVDIFKNLIEYNHQQKTLCFEHDIWCCPICMTEDSGLNFVQFQNCGDYFCKDCFSQYCVHKIREGQVDFSCPGHNCKTQIPPGVLKQHISQIEFSRWEDLLLKRTLETMQDIKYCPKCSTPCLEESRKLSQCTKCFYAFCTDCYRLWHPGSDCVSLEDRLKELEMSLDESEVSKSDRGRLLKDLENQIASLDVIKKESRPCPWCGMAIEKIGGCNHMICVYCNTHYCHACGEAIFDGYSHFGAETCILFDDEAIEEWEREMNGDEAAGDGGGPVPRRLQEMDARPMLRCGVCRAVNYKIDNNNHIRCRVCSTNMCFLCRRVLPKKNVIAHFRHGQCIQHTNL